MAKATSVDIAQRQRRYQKLKRVGKATATSRDADAITAKRAMLVGTGVALVLYVVPLTRFVLSYLAILFHELGHTTVGFLFGYPSIPSFDFVYGGGVTLYFGRSTALIVLVGMGWIALLARLRHWPRLMVLTGLVAVVWLVAATSSLHDIFLNASGHGAELLFAGWCFFKVLSGHVRSSTERWLYAMCGSFLVLSAWMFALRLVESDVARREYGQAKGGGHWMDMSRIARALEWDLVPVALVYWLLATALPLVVHLCWINRERIGAWLANPRPQDA